MWKQVTLTILTTSYLVSGQELKVYFSEEEIQTEGIEEGQNSRLLTVRLDKESLQPGVMERLSKTSNIIFADFPGLPEFVNAKEYEDILNSLYNGKEDQDNSQANQSVIEGSTNSIDEKDKEERHIEIIEEEPKRENKEDYAKDTLKEDHKEEMEKKKEDNLKHSEENQNKDYDDIDYKHGDDKENYGDKEMKEHDDKKTDYDQEDKEHEKSKEGNNNKKEEYEDKEHKNEDNKEEEHEDKDHTNEDNKEEEYEDNEDHKKNKHKNIVTSYTLSCESNSTETGSVYKEKKISSSNISSFSTKTKSGVKTSKTAIARKQNSTIFNATNITNIIIEEENNSFNLSPAALPLALLVATVTFMLSF